MGLCCRSVHQWRQLRQECYKSIRFKLQSRIIFICQHLLMNHERTHKTIGNKYFILMKEEDGFISPLEEKEIEQNKQQDEILILTYRIYSITIIVTVDYKLNKLVSLGHWRIIYNTYPSLIVHSCRDNHLYPLCVIVCVQVNDITILYSLIITNVSTYKKDKLIMVCTHEECTLRLLEDIVHLKERCKRQDEE